MCKRPFRAQHRKIVKDSLLGFPAAKNSNFPTVWCGIRATANRRVDENATLPSSDIRSRILRFTSEVRNANQALVDCLTRSRNGKSRLLVRSRSLGCLPRSRGWFRSQARRLERLDENIGAVAVGLRSDDLREIESAASKITVQEARCPEELERMTGL